MIAVAKKKALENYNALTNSCADLCVESLKAGGLDGGRGEDVFNPKPLDIYKGIILSNTFINVTPGQPTIQGQDPKYGPVPTQ